MSIISIRSARSSRVVIGIVSAVALAVPAAGTAHAAAPAHAGQAVVAHGPAKQLRRQVLRSKVRAHTRLSAAGDIRVAAVLRPLRCWLTSNSQATCDLVFLAESPAAYYTYTMNFAMIDGVWVQISDQLQYGYGD